MSRDDAVTSTLTVSLVYDDAREGIRWLTDVLGFSVASLYEAPGGGVAFAELVWRSSVIFVSDRPAEGNAWAVVGPTSVALAVEDGEAVDQLFERVVASSVDVVRPVHDSKTPAFPEGSHQFDVRDPGGNLWTVGTYVPRVALGDVAV